MTLETDIKCVHRRNLRTTQNRGNPVNVTTPVHKTFFSCCGNQTLVELINELQERDLPNATNQWISLDNVRLSSQDHFAMVEALKARDEVLMATTVKTHLTRWQ